MSIDERSIARFVSKVEVTESCWQWRGALGHGGYGCFWYEGRNISAHVMACHLFLGTPINRPRTETIDHLCRNRWCVRPSHLRPGLHSTNILMALDRHRNTIKTHCPQGHEYTVENTIVGMSPTGRPWRKCRTCHNEHQRDYRKRKGN